MESIMAKWNVSVRVSLLFLASLFSCFAFSSISHAGRVVTECRTVYTVIRSPWGTDYLVPQLSCWDTWADDGREGGGRDGPDVGGGGGGGEGPDLEPAPAEDNSDKGSCEQTSQPVAIATGRKLLDEVDLSYAGELPLALRRHYRSGTSAVGAFGRKWLSNLDYKLEFRYAGTGYAQKICEYEPGVTDPDCAQPQSAQALSSIVAYRDGAAVYTFDLFDSASNKWNDSKAKSVTFMQPDVVGNPSKWTLYHEDGTIEVYNKSGRIESAHNKMGVGLTFTYDAQNKLQTVKHSSGRTLTLMWSGNRVSSVADPAGKKTQYAYNGNGYLEKVTFPDTTTRTYHYEDASPGNLTGVSVNGVRYSRVSYYANGQVKESGLEGGIDKSSFSYTSNTTTVTGALGGATTYTYSTDAKGIKRLSGVSRNGSSICPAAAASTAYDINGNIDYEVDWKGQRIEYSYSDKGRLLTQYGFGRTKVNTWDDANNRIVKTEVTQGNRRAVLPTRPARRAARPS